MKNTLKNFFSSCACDVLCVICVILLVVALVALVALPAASLAANIALVSVPVFFAGSLLPLLW